MLESIYSANIGSYLGVPVYLSNGTLFGTVCAIDPDPYAFTSEEIEGMKRVSSILSVIIENATRSSYDTHEDKLMRLEKLALLGQLSAGLAHELRNPMQSVRGFVQFLFEEQNHHYKDIVLTELDRMNQLVNDFLMATQPTAPKKEKYVLEEIVEETIELIRGEAHLYNVEVHFAPETKTTLVFVDHSQIKQVLINLLKNAIEAVGEASGKIIVSTKRISQEVVVIEVIDNGVGISITIIERLGEPFFSTKDKGTGLGLSISKRIIQEHQGMIEFKNTQAGTKVSVTLPIVSL